MPTLELIEQSLKSTIYDPFHNSESLEFYGDSILKLVASMLVFLNHPEYDEHNLSVKRQEFISNRFLRLINIGNRFFEHMMTEKVYMNFPGVTSYKETVMENKMGEEIIPDKKLADLIEALIGVYYLWYHDINACTGLMHAIGIMEYPILRVQMIAEIFPNNPLVNYFRELEDKIGYEFKNK